MFKCKYCPYTVKRREWLKPHEMRHTRNFPYNCEFCPKGYPNKQEYTIHLNSHLGIRPFPCPHCPKKFSQRPHLTSHLRIHTGDKPFKCTLCPKQFTQSSHLRTHHLHHTGEKPFKCQVCGDSFRLSSTLKCHMRRHTGEKPYKCHKCPMRFSQTSPLYHHMAKEHPPSSDKPYPFTCSRCKKGFFLKQFWKEHERQGCGEIKRFTCLFCQRRGGGRHGKHFTISKFSHQSDLEDHLRKHTEERPYFCSFCDLCFIDKKAKEYHMRIHLNDRVQKKEIKIREMEKTDVVSVKLYQCQHCHHSFGEKERLDVHLKQNHAPEDKTELEQVNCKKAKNKKLVKRKVPIDFDHFVKMSKIFVGESKQRPFKCSKCIYSFQTKDGRALHVKIVHDGILEWKCELCWKMFPTEEKLHWHTDLQHGTLEIKSEEIKCDLNSVKIEPKIENTADLFDNIMSLQ